MEDPGPQKNPADDWHVPEHAVTTVAPLAVPNVPGALFAAHTYMDKSATALIM